MQHSKPLQQRVRKEERAASTSNSTYSEREERSQTPPDLNSDVRVSRPMLAQDSRAFPTSNCWKLKRRRRKRREMPLKSKAIILKALTKTRTRK